MTANNVVAATLQLKLKADSGYTSEESHRISADQWGDVLRVATGQLSSVERDQLKAMSVANILVDVVPGEDGMGQEVYAKSVDDVVNLISKLHGEVDELELQRDQLLLLVKRFASIMEGCGNWPDTSTSQVSLGDLASEANDVLAQVKGGVA